MPRAAGAGCGIARASPPPSRLSPTALALNILLLLLLHAPDGSELAINSQAITSLRPRGDAPAKRLFPHAAHCLVGLSDGKAAAVVETCSMVRALIID